MNSHIIMDCVNSFQEFAFYPISIYPKIIGFILTWIFPYAFASFYPADYFLHMQYGILSVLTPVIAILLWIIALRVWKWGLKNYESTGS